MLNKLANFLFEPKIPSADYTQYRQARLTSIVAFTFLILVVLINIGMANVRGTAANPQVLAATLFSALILICYLLSRTKHFTLAAIGIVLVEIAFIITSFLLNPDASPLMLIYLLVAVTIAGFLLPLKTTIGSWLGCILISIVLATIFSEKADGEWLRVFRLQIAFGALMVAAAYARHKDSLLIHSQQEMLSRANETLEKTLLGQSERLQATSSQLAIEQQSRQMTEVALQQKQRLEGVGLLASGIVHDFNNLLTGIGNQVALAKLKSDVDTPSHRHIEKAYVQLNRTADITRQLLAYAGGNEIHKEPLDFADLVNGMGELLQRVVSKDVKLVVNNRAENPLIVDGDRGQLQQVVLNLIVNGADAIDGAGSVTVSLAEVELDEQSAELDSSLTDNALTHGDYVALTVQDTGCGMTAETISKIFDPFFTTKETGHGLGLSAVLGILRTHEAGLFVESTEGVGTTFRILFPCHLLIEDALEPTYHPDSFVTNSTLRFLVVDDDQAVRESIKDMLIVMGHDVVAAENGQIGVEHVESADDTFDLILLDLDMPVMNGQTAFYAMRNHNPSLPIVINSGCSETHITNMLLSEPATTFLPKPYTTDQLNSAISAVLVSG